MRGSSKQLLGVAYHTMILAVTYLQQLSGEHCGERHQHQERTVKAGKQGRTKRQGASDTKAVIVHNAFG